MVTNIQTHSVVCVCVCVCVFERDLAASRKWQRSEYWSPWRKDWKGKTENLLFDKNAAAKTWKISLTAAQTEVEVIRHSWRHPQSSISYSVPCTTWKLISFGGAAKQSQQPHQKKVFNDCLSQSGSRGNKVSQVSPTAWHASAEKWRPPAKLDLEIWGWHWVASYHKIRSVSRQGEGGSSEALQSVFQGDACRVPPMKKLPTLRESVHFSPLSRC